MYKNLCAIGLVLTLSASLYAQDQTLLSGGLESGGFGGPVVKIGPMKGSAGILVGGYGGWLINHQFLLGGGGFGLVNDIRASSEAETRYSPLGRPIYLNFGYGGGILEYIFTPSELVHFYINMLVGGGAAGYRYSLFEDEHHDLFDWNSDPAHRTDLFFVFEPSVNVELNVTTWFRLGAGASYRYISGINRFVGLKNTDFTGPSGVLTLKFGHF